ncbi:MAG: hypothetical protein RL885_02525 [Planctomycetota bacterium]
MQISAAFKDSNVVEADLLDFAAIHIEAGATPRPIQAGDFVGFEIAFKDDEYFERQWYLRSGWQMLFVTYTCDFRSRDAEDDLIQDILSSLSASNAQSG